MPIDRALLQFVDRSRLLRQGVPPPPGLSAAVANAAARIAATAHPDPRLLRLDGYLAQQFANLGLPVVISWKNPLPRPGHVAMVRPETGSARGVVHASGVFLPRSAQAGAENYQDKPAYWIASGRYLTRQLWVHA